MQLRCTYCQNMFALSHEELLAALEHMEENNQVYYDAHCPKCRRANRVERARMERFFPDWKNAIKAMAKQSAKTETAAEIPVARTQQVMVAVAPGSAPKTLKRHAPKTGSATEAAARPAPKAQDKVAPKTKPATAKKAVVKKSSSRAVKTPAGKKVTVGKKKTAGSRKK